MVGGGGGGGGCYQPGVYVPQGTFSSWERASHHALH